MYYPTMENSVDGGDFFENIKAEKLLNKIMDQVSTIKDVEFNDSIVFGQLT